MELTIFIPLQVDLSQFEYSAAKRNSGNTSKVCGLKCHFFTRNSVRNFNKLIAWDSLLPKSKRVRRTYLFGILKDL